jgi:hypothetical protein
MNRWEEAAGVYGELARRWPENWQARLGQVRCALAQGEWEKARRLRAEVLLACGQWDRRAMEECIMLRAQQNYRRQHHRTELDPWNSQQWVWPASCPPHERLCEWLLREAAGSASDSRRSFGDNSVVWTDAGMFGGVEPLVTGVWPLASVGEHLRRLCAALGWELQVGAECVAALETTVVRVSVVAVPVNEVLACLAESAGVNGQRQGWTYVVSRTEQEAPVASYLQAHIWCTSHPWRHAVQLLLGYEYRQAAYGEWSQWYYRQVQAEGTLPERAAAFYNSALLEWENGRWAVARARLYDLLDLVPSSVWQWRARWWLGRIALEYGEPAEAEQHWQIVLQSPESQWRAAAALGLQFLAALHDEDALLTQRWHQWRLPAQEPYLAWSDLLEAYMDYRRQPSPSRGERVAAALDRVGECSMLGRAGRYWAGQVWWRLGHGPQMVRCYDQSQAPGRSPWLLKMWEATASYYHQLGLWDRSRPHDLALVASDPYGLGRRAALRLAEASWQRGQLTECLHYARWLRQIPDEQSQRAALQLVGRVYERWGQYRAAADCFAGRWPDEEPTYSSSK